MSVLPTTWAKYHQLQQFEQKLNYYLTKLLKVDLSIVVLKIYNEERGGLMSK